jgi:hypothetical protein
MTDLISRLRCAAPSIEKWEDLAYITNEDRKEAADRIEALERELAAVKAEQEAPEHIHSCGYHCERPTCVKDQRDELVRVFIVNKDAPELRKAWPTDTNFNDWWNADRLTQNNPYEEDTPAYWAWEGWQARALLFSKQGDKK